MSIIEEAKSGVTPFIRKIAEKERVSEEFVRNGIISGRIVAPCNPIHNPEPAAIGEGMSIKVNVNLGTSRDMPEMENELKKLDVALKYGADAVMDLSTGGDIHNPQSYSCFQSVAGWLRKIGRAYGLSPQNRYS